MFIQHFNLVMDNKHKVVKTHQKYVVKLISTWVFLFNAASLLQNLNLGWQKFSSLASILPLTHMEILSPGYSRDGFLIVFL